MTEKQKQAVLLIGKLCAEGRIDEEEFMLLIENVLEERKVVYYPTYPTYPNTTPDVIYEHAYEPASVITTTEGG